MRHARRFFHRLTSLFRSGTAEAELSREIEAHLRLIEDGFVERGMSRDDARHAARRSFGGVEQAKELQRDARTFPALSGWSTDLMLGVRMLTKYPGLTVAGGLTLAIGLGLGAAWFDFASELFRPTLPLPGGERLVHVSVENTLTSSEERRLLHDFVVWREDLQTIDGLGAFRSIDRNIALGNGPRETVKAAEVTASALRLAGTAPLLGRPLLDEDERPGAPAVAVLGYQVWQRLFAGRPDALGQTVELGGVTATVVGVMPEGFMFPVNHRVWVPLHLRPSGYAPLEGPAISVVGRLSSGAGIAQAEAELAVIAAREAAASPATHEHLRPRVSRYGAVIPGPYLGLSLTHIPILVILFIVCVNVGTLVYARTATRESEIATRFTIGASRGRIVTQLFIEALALVALAGSVGLAVADWALTVGAAAFYSNDSGGPPFWIEPGLRFSTVLYALLLGVTAAAFLSLLPALRATGARAQARLATTGERSTLRFGRAWTAAMIAQVALSVFAIPMARQAATESLGDRQVREAFPAESYLAVRLDVDREMGPEGTPDSAEQAGQIYAELQRRVAGEPGVRAVTYARTLPGLDVAPRRVEIEGAGGAPSLFRTVWTDAIGPGYLETFERRIIAGRDFHDGDRVDGVTTVIVNEAFARRYGGALAIGRHVRYTAANQSPTGPWLEIVGVVQDVGMTPIREGEAPYVIHAAAPGSLMPALMGVHVSGDPSTLAVRVRTIAAELDPRLRVIDAGSLEDWRRRRDLPNLIGAGALGLVLSLGLFLSASGIFALVSVTIGRRMRELGVRVALGASSRRLLSSIFLRVLMLVGCGIVAGNILVMLFLGLDGLPDLGFVAESLLITSAVMLLAGLLACAQPIRRILRINPTDALRTV